MKSVPIIVTDHALVRYIERVRGIDLDTVRQEIAAEVRDAIRAKATGYFDGGFTYRLDGSKVVTIIEGKAGVTEATRRAVLVSMGA